MFYLTDPTISRVMTILLNNIFFFNYLQESYRKLAYDIEQAKLYVMNKLTRLNRHWERTRDEYLRKLNELNRSK